MDGYDADKEVGRGERKNRAESGGEGGVMCVEMESGERERRAGGGVTVGASQPPRIIKAVALIITPLLKTGGGCVTWVFARFLDFACHGSAGLTMTVLYWAGLT